MSIDPLNNCFVKTPDASIHCYNFSNSPDIETYYCNNDEDALEYDDWPGQIELISISIASSITESNDSFNYTDNFKFSPTHKVQEQLEALAETQALTYAKYYTMREDNSSLVAINRKLEQRIHDLEVKSEEQIANEQNRIKKRMFYLEQNNRLKIKDHTLKLQILENENSQLMEDNSNLRTQVEHLKSEGHRREELLQEVQENNMSLQNKYTELEESFKKGQISFSDKNFENSELVKDLCHENETLKDSLMECLSEELSIFLDGGKYVFEDVVTRFSEMESEIRSLKEENASLSETNEELQAQMLNWGLEERNVLLNRPSDASLVAQFEAMNEIEILNTLKEQQEVITSLRRYIDGILTNIIDKYPKLLEVRK